MAVSAGRWGSPWGCGFPLEAEDVVKAMARPWLLCAARDAAPIICGTPPWNDARWYDPAGNRQPADNHSYNTYNAANMLTASNGSTYTNDLNGNTVTGGGRTSIWDSQNRLVQTTFNGVTTGFTSGPDGLRRTATTGGVTTQYILDGQNVAQEVNPAGTVRYIWGPRGPECRIDASGDPLWFLYDGHGNVIAEAGEPDQYGNPIKGMRNYGPWGGSTQSGTLESSLTYCGSLGHPSENTTGLIYMRARYYDPALGRFISEDPAKDGGNWFAYAGNDPVGMVDRDGRFTLGEVIGGAAAAGSLDGAAGCALSGLSSGVISKLMGGSFLTGFATGALTASAGLLWGIAGGMAAGSSFGAAVSFANGGNPAMGAFFGGAGGALGAKVNTDGLISGLYADTPDYVAWLQDVLMCLSPGAPLGVAAGL